MKRLIYCTITFLLAVHSLFSQHETRPFVLSKNDYFFLEDKNQLISEAIVNAFGVANASNNYKLDILQIDASNIKIKEFKYFPNMSNENKEMLKNKINAYPENYFLEFKVKINSKNSVLTDKIKSCIDKKNCLVLNLTIIGNPKIFVIEIRNSEKLDELLKDKSFVAKAFKKRFGDEQKNNYEIQYDQINTCLKQDIFDSKCEKEYEINQSESNYEDFKNALTSNEYKGAYVLFNVLINTKKSKLNPLIEEAIIKDKDGIDKLKFYLCLPGEKQINSEKKTDPVVHVPEVKAANLGSIKGRMLAVNSKMNPIINKTVELRTSDQTIVKSQKTDQNGDFEFTNVNLENNYFIDLVNYDFDQKSTKIYIANLKNDLIKELIKGKDGKFSYHTIEADMYRLTTMNDSDIELTFSIQKRNKKQTIFIQDFLYYNLNSFEISNESAITINKIIKLLNENNDYHLDIISHTDSRGDATENLKLSQKRSEAVCAYIIKNGSIEPQKLKAIGLGETKPLNSCSESSNCVESENKMNRRTEFLFTKK